MNESQTQSAEEAAGKFLAVDKDNLTSEMIVAGIAFLAVLVLIISILCCIRFFYAKLPKVLKSLIVAIKAKLMWSSVLRFMAQKYLDQSILCMLSLQ